MNLLPHDSTLTNTHERRAGPTEAKYNTIHEEQNTNNNYATKHEQTRGAIEYPKPNPTIAITKHHKSKTLEEQTTNTLAVEWHGLGCKIQPLGGRSWGQD